MDERAWQLLAERMYTIRRRLGLTSKELATRVGTGRTTISRLENTSKPQVTFDVLVRIADVLGVSLDYLAGRKDDERVEFEPAAVAELGRHDPQKPPCQRKRQGAAD
jgi:transcriptional regulator with XRE-family HTH domain